MQQDLDKSVTRELREVATEFEAEFYRLSSLGPTDWSNLYEGTPLKRSQ